MAVGVGLVGYGLAGRILHAPVIAAAGMAIRAVVTSRSDQVSADWPAAAPVADLDALLGRDDIDLVVIATPNHLHHPQARAALESGRHVVVDKPFTLTAAEAADLIGIADERGLKLSVYHNRRWDSDYLTLSGLVASGRLGEVLSLEIRYDRWRPEPVDRWRERDQPGAGMLFDLGPHIIDQALRLSGRPDWVMADLQRQRPGSPVDDCVGIWMGRGRQRIALAISMLAADHALRYRVHGTGGSFAKSGIDPQEGRLKAGMVPLADGFGAEPAEIAGLLTTPDGVQETVPSERGRWIDYYRGIRAAIEAGAPVPVDPRDAAEIVEIIELVRKSATTGQRLAVPPDPWR